MASNTKLQAKAAKARRQKMIAIGGSVLLAVVLAIQVPRTMKMLDGGSTPPPTPSAASQPAASTDPAAQPVAAQAAPAGKLPDRNALPEPSNGQLASFELFESKDPFAQQVAEEAPSAAAATGVPSSPTGSASGGSTSGGSTPQTSTPERSPASVPSGRKSSSRTVSISVNGSDETVGLSQSFPAADPTFVLVSSDARSAKISVAGGRLADGAQTVTLQLGRKLTLVNTADGARYELLLNSTG
jgi:hypothetical protein